MSKKSNKQAKLTRESGMFKKEGLSLGCRVRDLRNEKGWTLEEAGLRMNMDPKHLWKLEHAYDGLNVTLVTLVRIANAFEIPVQSLFAYRGETRDPLPRRKKGNTHNKGLAFRYVDAPSHKEFSTCVPLYNLSKDSNIYPKLFVNTWVCLNDELQEQFNVHETSVIQLNENLSQKLSHAKFAIMHQSKQWRSDAYAILHHPELDEEYILAKVILDQESSCLRIYRADDAIEDYLDTNHESLTHSISLTLDQCSSLKILGYLAMLIHR